VNTANQIVSVDTLKTSDLITAIGAALCALDDDEIKRETLSFLSQIRDDPGWWDSEDAGWVLTGLWDIAEAVAAPYCRFGTADGDGACFGWFPNVDILLEDIDNGEVTKIAAGDEFPEQHDKFVATVTDHGNLTLHGWDADKRCWTELWSVI
jgi:hypothetical protein